LRTWSCDFRRGRSGIAATCDPGGRGYRETDNAAADKLDHDRLLPALLPELRGRYYHVAIPGWVEKVHASARAERGFQPPAQLGATFGSAGPGFAGLTVRD
jgi:hypothetical protein